MANLHSAVILYQGDDLVIEGDLHAADGTALDLSGTPAATWRVLSPDGLTVAFNYSIGNGITVTDALGGKVSILVPKAQTLALAVGIYRDQLVATVAGVTETQWIGTLDVRASI